MYLKVVVSQKIDDLQDLPFRRGDTLTIIAPSKDPNWYKARRYDGLEGMIPYNYVQQKKDVDNQPLPPPAQPPSNPKGAAAAGNRSEHLRKAVKLHSMP